MCNKLPAVDAAVTLLFAMYAAGAAPMRQDVRCDTMRSQDKKGHGRIPSDILVFLTAIGALIITVVAVWLFIRLLGQ